MQAGPRIEAVVFDLFYTLVHPGTYPGGTNRVGWLAGIAGVDVAALKAQWTAFEPVLEAGRAPMHRTPELEWFQAAAANLGATVTSSDLARVEADWDLTRREALLKPPPSTIAALLALRRNGLRLGVLSNTHALEVRVWDRSPLASLVDVVAFSHEIGFCKPAPETYAYVLDRLSVPAAAAAYVGDGGSDELTGARAAGFRRVILAEETAVTSAPDDLPRLRGQADDSVASLTDVLELVSSE
jgi:putative hydrolase of the HAD superfamily